MSGAFNGAGLFVLSAPEYPAVATTLIQSAYRNTLDAAIATGLSTCITKDGQTTVAANIPFSGFKITGLGAASARGDAASLASNQDQTGIYCGTAGGTADAITLTPVPAITSYTAGQSFAFLASGANTTAVTVNVSSLGVKSVTKNGAVALSAGEIASGALVVISYDGTRFQVTGIASGLFADGSVGAPGISFASDPDTGFYKQTGNRISVSCGAILKFTIDNAFVESSVVFGVPDGAVGAPGYYFASDPDTGWFRSGSGTTQYAANGSNVVQFGPFSAGSLQFADLGGTYQFAGFRDVPQVIQNSSASFALTDAGKHWYHSSASVHTWTIPANGSVAFPVGTAISLVNTNGGGNISVAITTDTLRLAGPGTTGTRTLAANGVATILKTATTEWFMSGSGIT